MPTTRQTYPIEFKGGLVTNMSPLQQGIKVVIVELKVIVNTIVVLYHRMVLL